MCTVDIGPAPGGENCSDGELRPVPGSVLFGMTPEGLSNVSLLLTVCVGRFLGGVCRRGFEDVDATVACRNLNFGLPGKILARFMEFIGVTLRICVSRC